VERFGLRRVLVGASALTLAIAGLTIATGGAVAAAPQLADPPSVQIGWTDSATPAKAYDADTANLPLGTWHDAAGKTHVSRVYATFDLSQFEGTKMYGGTIYLDEDLGADCTKRAIEIWRTDPVGRTPTWNKAPAPTAKLGENLTPGLCARTTLPFDVGSALQDAAAHKQRRITFEIRVPEQHESDPAYGAGLYWLRPVQLTVQYNAVPTIDNTHLFNGGFACTQLKPYPRLGGLAGTLQSLGNDADPEDRAALSTEFAVWPVGDATARTVYTPDRGAAGRVNTVRLPAGALIDGKSYGWQSRVGDGADFSLWSKKCFFTYDATKPPTPTVTSNYPPSSSGASAPVGVPATFTFTGNGNKDVAGFQYSWTALGVNACDNSGDAGQLVCPDPLTYPGTVKAGTPGGSATVTLNPPSSGPQQLTVRSIDVAGNTSPNTVYAVSVPFAEPTVALVGGDPEWNQDVLLQLTPAAGVTGVDEYEITVDGGDVQTRDADADGAAYFSFRATNPDGVQVTVRSHSANGFVSPAANWRHYFDPWPGVHSDTYFYPEDGHAVGGPGVEGTFTFSPVPGWTDTVAYRYSFTDESDLTEVAADSDGRATITWAPEASGPVTLIVYAVRADGTVSDYSNYYSFEVGS
jgi:hypothetical protein